MAPTACVACTSYMVASPAGVLFTLSANLCRFPVPRPRLYVAWRSTELLLGRLGSCSFHEFFCVQVIWLIVKIETPYFNSPNLLHRFVVRISVLEKLVRPQPPEAQGQLAWVLRVSIDRRYAPSIIYDISTWTGYVSSSHCTLIEVTLSTSA